MFIFFESMVELNLQKKKSGISMFVFRSYKIMPSKEHLSTTWIAAEILIVNVVGAAFLVYLVKIKKTIKKAK